MANIANDRRGVARPGASDRGTNQTGVRLYNERLVLSLIRLHGELPKADIARLTGLSPQTISIITNQLTADGLLLKGQPQRGRIGQPSVPYSLNPEGALAFGLKVGRRSVDLYLIDFTGRIIRALHKTYAYPTLAATRQFTTDGISEILATLKPGLVSRIAGLGIGAPYEMWTWHEEIGALLFFRHDGTVGDGIGLRRVDLHVAFVAHVTSDDEVAHVLS